MRHGLNNDLDFSSEDRAENIHRVDEVAALTAHTDMITLTAFISPDRSDQDRAREAHGEGFHEIHVEADLETCEECDPQGLYKKARANEITDLKGVSAPYEAPDGAQLVVDTGNYSVEECIQFVTEYIQQNFVLDKTQAWA